MRISGPIAARERLRRVIRRALPWIPPSLRTGVASRVDFVGSGPRDQWLREVMNRDTDRVFESLDPPTLDVVEVSGEVRALWPWRSYTSLSYPEFDLCDRSTWPARQFDLVISEQVLEHVPDPGTAVKGLRALCGPTGFVYVSTPFLIRLHDDPLDYWRFTPLGLETLLRSNGLEPLWVRSWGNRRAIVANFDRWVSRFSWQSLENDPRLPVVVWALARPSNDSPPV
jgi:hypothetical protein